LPFRQKNRATLSDHPIAIKARSKRIIDILREKSRDKLWWKKLILKQFGKAARSTSTASTGTIPFSGITPNGNGSTSRDFSKNFD
jgi:hypothetical protein